MDVCRGCDHMVVPAARRARALPDRQWHTFEEHWKTPVQRDPHMSERAMNASASAVRHFTLEEANRTLPLVKMIVRDIVELFPDVQRRRERLDDLLSKSRRKPRPGDMHAEALQQME